MKIAQKLLTTTLVLALLPMLVVGSIGFVLSQHILQHQIQDQLNNTAKHQLDRINTLNAVINTQLNNLQFETQLRLLLSEYDTKPSTALQNQLNQSLGNILTSADTFQRVYVTGTGSTVVAATDPSLIGEDIKSNEAYQAGLKAPDSSVLFKSQDGEPSQYLAVPLELNGQHLGVLLVEATAYQYLVVTKDYSELGQTGESYLVRKTNQGVWQYLTPLRFDANDALQAVDNNNPFSVVDYRHQHVLEATRPVPSTAWTLVVHIDVAEVEAPLVHLRQILTWVLIITAVMAAVSAWYLSRFMTVPIKRITAVVTKIREGDLSLRVDVRSKDEIGLLGTAFNEMKTSLVETEARLKASIGSLPFGFAIIDSQNQMVFYNDALKHLVNKPLDEGAGSTSAKALERLSVNLSTAVDMQDCIKASQGRREIIEKNIELGPKFFRLLFVPVINHTEATDKVVGSVLIMEDTTDKRAMERSRDEFFSIASHELRTPLTAIRGNSDMVLNYYSEALKDKGLKEMITDIHDSSMRLIDIVNDFLDSSRLEQGRATFNKTACDVPALIEQTLREYDVTGSRRKLYLKFEPPAKPLPPVLVDRDRTRQILVNLLGNAIKFTQEGGVTIAAELTKKFVKISVTDTGSGIPVASQHLLFRKFQQASNNILTRDSTQSTGLGLYISKMLAEGMGGKLYLERTEEGKGSTFSLELVVADASNTPPAAVSQAAAPAADAAASTGQTPISSPIAEPATTVAATDKTSVSDKASKPVSKATKAKP